MQAVKQRDSSEESKNYRKRSRSNEKQRKTTKQQNQSGEIQICDPVQLEIVGDPQERPLPQIKVFSFNILAQHLIDDEFPLYQHKNDPKNISQLLERREAQFKLLLKQQIFEAFDILNVQEMGPMDLELLHRLCKFLNKENKQYNLEVAQYPTGGQNLRCAVFYNYKKLELVTTRGLFQKKEDTTTQFGIVQHFRHNQMREFINCSIHLSGGVKQSDEKSRKIQLSIIEDDDFWKKRLPVILSGDFNSDIQFEALSQVQHIHDLKPVFPKVFVYNTEHRVQYRKRDGWDEDDPIQIVIRPVDSIFCTGFQIYARTQLTDDFNYYVKMKKLRQFEKQENKDDILDCKTQVGFPSDLWPSDHIYVGAIFTLPKQ